MNHRMRDIFEVVLADDHVALARLISAVPTSVHQQKAGGETPIFCCRSLACLEVLVQAGANVNARRDDLWTPLHRAADGNHPALIGGLLQAGADLNVVDEQGNSPLHIAIMWTETDAARELLLHHPDLSLQDLDGNTVLHIAVLEADLEICQWLIQAGANPTTRNHADASAVDLADWSDNDELIELFQRR